MQDFLMYHPSLQVLVVVCIVALTIHPVLRVMLVPGLLIRVIPCIMFNAAVAEHPFDAAVVWIVSAGRVAFRRTVGPFRVM